MNLTQTKQETINQYKTDPYNKGWWECIADLSKDCLNLDYGSKDYVILFHNIDDYAKYPEVFKFVVLDWKNIKVVVYREPELKVYTFKDYNSLIKSLKFNESYFIKEGMKINDDNLKRVYFFKDMHKHKIKELNKGNTHIKIGDFLSTCWGYDQTNVELFIIKKIIGKNYFIIQEVAQQTDGKNRLMYDNVKVSDNVDKIDLPIKARNLKSISAGRRLSIEKAKRDLDFMPDVDLEEGIFRTIEWYKKENLL